jgi:hypothetical protein
MAKEAKSATSKETKPTSATAEKASSSTSETSTSSETSAPTGKKTGSSSRPISYFSSVSTDEYRSGWEEIFGGQKPKKEKNITPRKSKLPTTLSIDFDDLDETTRQSLESVARKSAKKQKINFDKIQAENRTVWSLSCRLLD